MYRPVYHAEAFHRLLALRPARLRARLIQQIEWLGQNPGHRGDFEIRDETGRKLQVLVCSGWTITYWADDAVSELRTVDARQQIR